MVNDTKSKVNSVAGFLESIKDSKRRADSQELTKIMHDATGVEPHMFGSSIIGFGKFHYNYDSGREGDTIVVGFAPRKDALVIYGVLFYDHSAQLINRIGPHTTGKGCIYIKDLSRINTDALSEMVTTAYKQKAV